MYKGMTLEIEARTHSSLIQLHQRKKDIEVKQY